jgi:hypothetical protein
VKPAAAGQNIDVLACALLGHRLRFRSEGALMRWECERCGGASGEKAYAGSEQARRYATAMDREDRAVLGRRPLLSLLPLKLLSGARRRA